MNGGLEIPFDRSYGGIDPYKEKEYEKEKTESVIIIIFCIQISEKEDKEIKTYR